MAIAWCSAKVDFHRKKVGCDAYLRTLILLDCSFTGT